MALPIKPGELQWILEEQFIILQLILVFATRTINIFYNSNFNIDSTLKQLVLGWQG